MSAGEAPPRRLMRRAERRQALIDAATRAFARSGFAATSLDDIAAEAGVARDTIYRNFDTKSDLYRAALSQITSQLREAGLIGHDPASIDRMLSVARRNPHGFRLLFRHAAREPEFRATIDEHRTAVTGTAEEQLRPFIPDPAQRQWAAQLLPTITTEVIITWLDAGQPGPERIADTLREIQRSVIRAIRH
jgi:AcrR family transcriptional regulator